jgi:hypothetical protein
LEERIMSVDRAQRNLTLSLATPPAGVRERRTVCRYTVVQENAWLGWWVGQDFQNTAAKIVDISLRGARLTVDAFPPKDQPAWFCPPGVTATDEWVEVKIIETKKRLFGSREVRLAFRKVLPYELFKAVVYGPDAFKGSDPISWIPEDAEERDWW